MQFKLDPRLARLLGVHTQTRPVIITSLWQYIKTHKLQDAHEREYINCDKYLNQVSRQKILCDPRGTDASIKIAKQKLDDWDEASIAECLEAAATECR